jgi:hypothetical protein
MQFGGRLCDRNQPKRRIVANGRQECPAGRAHSDDPQSNRGHIARPSLALQALGE